MVDKTQNWSSNWKSSKQPRKQRKYRENAPQHVKDKFLSANLDHVLREELNTRNITIRTGDQAKVVRGDHKGKEGIINKTDKEKGIVYINNLEVERQDGAKSQVPLRPSNLQLTALNVDELSRIEKYDVDDVETIKVDEEEVEEALEEDEENEMMQRMQQQNEDEETEEEEDESEDEEIEEETQEQEEKSEAETTNLDEVVDNTISDAKEEIGKIDSPDYDQLIQAEKDNKNRKTFIEYLENQKEE